MQAIADYLHHISALPASGEYALNTLLTACFESSAENPEMQRPRVLARDPLAPQYFTHLRGSSGRKRSDPVDLCTEDDIDANKTEKGVPLLILYGDNDWLCFPEVNSYVDTLRNYGVDASLSVIRQAGHHLYMDNPDQYHDEIRGWVRNRILTKN